MSKKFEYIDDNPGSYFDMLVESVEDKKELKEDKFVPQDKISKKAKKELDSQKRNTWGNTNPVTRVQPNKKAYNRKRDKKIENESLQENFNIELKDYKKDEDVKDGYTFNFIVNGHPVSMGCWTEDLGDGEYGDFIVDFDDYSQLDFISEDELDDLWEKLGDIIETKVLKNESLKESKKLNESSDGWDESKLYDLSEILDEIYNLQYEVQNTVRGAYTNAHTYEELGYYVHNLGSNLMDVGDEIMEMEEEEDEEDED